MLTFAEGWRDADGCTTVTGITGGNHSDDATVTFEGVGEPVCDAEDCSCEGDAYLLITDGGRGFDEITVTGPVSGDSVYTRWELVND